MAAPEDVERSELEAVLEVHRELGPSYEPALVDSFADKVEAVIATRVDAELVAHQRSRSLDRRHSGQQLALGIVSLVAAIPITIPLAITDHLSAVLIAWIGIVIVNIAHAWQNRRAE